MTLSSRKPRAPILLIDDEEQALTSYALNLRFSGLNNTVSLSDSRKAPDLLASRKFSLVILDLSMPHLGGEQILEHMRRLGLDVPAIVITGQNDVETAVRCLRGGSFDYLVKPVDRTRLLAAVTQALEGRPPGPTPAAPAAPAPGGEGGARILTRNPVMARIRADLAAVAVSREPALVVGETGVGKELAARAIHEAGLAVGRKGPFIGCNVAGLDDVMLTDTLFGHRKGAFTGAQTERGGLMEEAAGGTLFLDEIGDLSLASQLKLLRCLQEREFYPLGADAPRPMDCRVVAATNRPVAELMNPDVFRRDLFFRLRTHLVVIPPLRERLDDLTVLAPHFLAEAAAEQGRPCPDIPERFYEVLAGHAFPGNVRELRSLLHHALTMLPPGEPTLSLEPVQAWIGSVGVASCPLPAAPLGELPTLRQAAARVTEGMIAEALRRTGGNQSRAAKLLGISRQALSKRCRNMRDVNPGCPVNSG
ncbi:sigma-54 dependent transcriptional regulator [Solidesulfovibrio sp.]|uniref:sigma-54-dependent transcriptional regulator n=1 Tax=Solidesulfovibrio sp. TaxID=2910990 RepID=UPI00261EF423|nr:sigma-54 dependent transcriptional regulator [Solidesulfovibrio sp.]